MNQEKPGPTTPRTDFSQSKIWLSLIIVIFILGLMCAGAAPSEKETSLEADLSNLQFAAGVFDAQFIDVPLNAPLVSCGLFVEGYKEGVVTNICGPGSVSSKPPEEAKTVRISVCVTPAKPPEIDLSKRIRRDYPRVPGTGSMRLGVSFRVMGKSGSANGTGSSLEVPNATFDFYELSGMKCLDLPFTIVDGHHEIRAMPVVVYLPRKFDPKSLKGKVEATSLPNGTIVVYAAIETSS